VVEWSGIENWELKTENCKLFGGDCGGAELFADAAGGRGVWWSGGFAFRIGMAETQGSLAEARQPFAMMRSPVGTGVKRNGMTIDPGTCQEHSTA